MLKLVAGILTSASFFSSAFAADWPTSRGDALRTGATSDTLPAKLSLAWKYESSDPPQPAWPRDDRMLLDRANEVVVVGSRAFFGSSAVVVPDASAGCQCSYQNRSWMALAGDE